ncbi:uncharacterized protein BYT42DRAFT_613238 [Radiomyces spectabilis]|uniref:uncharacterized protein n=1 Tax=Radiomyces spectabilis TaxID=64574 RepID=UPI00221FC429|nr:uncharacterized protein BYT42DRAFT_613238 [Radiomyces spectabilis]KAI8381462.1 hypothetical protein BYT42DRAFT_613238 [Radiomyces spectabilis]
MSSPSSVATNSAVPTNGNTVSTWLGSSTFNTAPTSYASFSGTPTSSFASSTLVSSTSSSAPASETSKTGIFGNPYEQPGLPTFQAQNQSAFTTQLIICFAVGLLCFLGFCILRTRGQKLIESMIPNHRHKPPELPNSFFGWIIPLLRINQEEMLDKVGLDAVVLLQFVVMCIKLFGLCAAFGLVVLIPISATTGNFTDTSITGIDKLSITVIDESSPYLIAYLIFTYFFCFTAFFFLHQSYSDYVYMRARYLLRLSKTLSCRSVIVTGIPKTLRSDQDLADYYENLGIGNVETCHVVRHVRNLGKLLKKRASALQHLERAYAQYWGNPCRIPDYDPDRILEDAQLLQRVDKLSEQSDYYNNNATFLSGLISPPSRKREKRRPQVRTGFLGLFGPKVDAIEYYTELFDELDQKVTEARNSKNYEMTNVGFVTFEHMTSALIASQIAINPQAFNCRTYMAYEPRDVLWENVLIRGRERLIREIFIWTITIALVFFWVFPISFFSSLTSIEALDKVFPGIADKADDIPIVKSIMQSLIPTLLVNIFMALLPLIFDSLGYVQGLRARSAIAESTFSKYFFFLLFNVLLVFTIVNIAVKTVAVARVAEQLINNPTEIPNVLATSLSTVAPFFINYTIMQGLLLMPLNLLLLGALVLRGFWHLFICKTPRDYAENRAPWAFNYGTGYPAPLLIFIIVLEYSVISPIILIFGTLYFCITYIVYKYQFLYVYFRPYEAAGRLWIMVFPRIIAGMVIFQLTMTGLFILKKFYVLGILCVPLIVITFIFKFTLDAAYRKNSQHLPMQLLRDEMTKLPTHNDPIIPADDDPYASESGSNSPDTPEPSPHRDSQRSNDTAGTSTTRKETKLRWRFAAALALKQHHTSNPSINSPPTKESPKLAHVKKVVIDEDDYEAVPDNLTDYRQPPMQLNPGVLDTGLKRYGNPALIGVLPQLWLPTKSLSPEEQANPSARRPSNKRRQSSGQLAHDLAHLLRRAESARRRVQGGIVAKMFDKQLDASKEKGVKDAEVISESTKDTSNSMLRKLLRGRTTSHSSYAKTQHSSMSRQATVSREHILLAESRSPSRSSDETPDDDDDDDSSHGDGYWLPLHRTYYHHPERRNSTPMPTRPRLEDRAQNSSPV